jgi:hypothetical protein
LDGLTFTFITYPDYGHAFALVDESDTTVLFFISYNPRVTAQDGPAEGMMSNTMPLINRRALQEGEGDTSIGLSGSGCAFDDFVFTEAESTPGEVNVGQEITECKAPDPTPAPTSAPTEKVGSNGLSTNAILGIAVGATVLCLLCIILGCDFNTNRKNRITEHDANFYWEEDEVHEKEGDEGGSESGRESVGDGFIED